MSVCLCLFLSFSIFYVYEYDCIYILYYYYSIYFKCSNAEHQKNIDDNKFQVVHIIIYWVWCFFLFICVCLFVSYFYKKKFFLLKIKYCHLTKRNQTKPNQEEYDFCDISTISHSQFMMILLLLLVSLFWNIDRAWFIFCSLCLLPFSKLLSLLFNTVTSSSSTSSYDNYHHIIFE